MDFAGEVSADDALDCYRALAKAVDEGVFRLDAAGRFASIDGAFLERTGLERSEVLGERLSTVLGGTDARRVEREIRGRLEADGDAVASLELAMETAAGEREPCEVLLAPLRGDGEFRGILGVVRPVADRDERDRELERYRTVVETINDGVYTVDADGRFTWANAAYAEMTGYSRDELVGEHVSLVVDEETIAEARRREEALLGGDGDPGPLEAELRTADGRAFPAEATFALIPSDDGEYERVGVVRDVTERKRAERELRRSEERFRSMMERSPHSTQIFDADGQTLAANPAWERLWGASRDELADYNILADEQLEVAGLTPEIRRAFDGEVVALPITHYDPAEIGKPGRDRWIEGHVYPLTAGDEEVAEVAIVHRDVTDRVERERELERANERLERSNERLEQFAHAASHDLQEPLRMVSSYLQMIEHRADELSAETEEFLAYAVDGADRMRAMIDALLQYSRVETQGEPFGPVDLDEVVADVRTDLRVPLAESDAKLTVESLPRVAGDEHQLRQVFQNLLRNAIAYSGDEPPRIRVWAERDGATWSVSVRDEGVGIDPAERERIFELFHRLHPRGDQSGSGIGLALCQRIVERHGGEIRVDSEPGEGSTFSFTVPADAESNE